MGQVNRNLPPYNVLENGAKVKLVHADDHYSAYIRSTAVDAEYYDILSRVISSIEHANKLNELPLRGDLVAAPYDGYYNRAIVLGAKSKELPVRVAFLDHGNVTDVRFDDLRVLPDDLKNAKRFIFRVYFDGVYRKAVNKAGLQLLKKLETDVQTLFTVHCSSNNSTIARKSIVKLVDVETNECLNDKLVPILSPPTEPKKVRNWI